MKVVSSTDAKYLGSEVTSDLILGDSVTFGDFTFEIMFVKTLENGNILIGSPNYQIELED